MDRINEHSKIVQEFLTEFAQNDPNAQLIFDPIHDRSLVIHNEWRGEDCIYGCAMQLDIIENQIWIQQNNTEIYVDRELIQRGVLPKNIILGFRSPSIRKILAAAHY
jgi:hypothetical protein